MFIKIPIILTVVYILLMTGYKLFKWKKEKGRVVSNRTVPGFRALYNRYIAGKRKKFIKMGFILLGILIFLDLMPKIYFLLRCYFQDDFTDVFYFYHAYMQNDGHLIILWNIYRVTAALTAVVVLIFILIRRNLDKKKYKNRLFNNPVIIISILLILSWFVREAMVYRIMDFPGYTFFNPVTYPLALSMASAGIKKVKVAHILIWYFSKILFLIFIIMIFHRLVDSFIGVLDLYFEDKL